MKPRKGFLGASPRARAIEYDLRLTLNQRLALMAAAGRILDATYPVDARMVEDLPRAVEKLRDAPQVPSQATAAANDVASMLIAMEWGFRAGERGLNLEAAKAEFQRIAAGEDR